MCLCVFILHVTASATTRHHAASRSAKSCKGKQDQKAEVQIELLHLLLCDLELSMAQQQAPAGCITLLSQTAAQA
jgi:hypothetical protein